MNEFVPAREEELYRWFKIIGLRILIKENYISIENTILRLNKKVNNNIKKYPEEKHVDCAKVLYRAEQYFLNLAIQIGRYIPEPAEYQ